MESLFAHTYLLLFGKLAAGGLLALAVPPFAMMERGFYKSTAVVYLALALIIATGEASLYLHAGKTQVVSLGEVALWVLFAVAFSAYCISLFLESGVLRARTFPVAVTLGFVAVAVTTYGYKPEGSSAVLGIPFVLSNWAGAALAGGTATGMLLGHWYLIESNLDLAPLHRMLRFVSLALRCDVAFVAAGLLLIWWWPGGPLEGGLNAAFGGTFVWLTVGRVVSWALAGTLVVLIGKTLAIPQTMAATGLFYIAALVVAVGEILSHWLLFRTGLPI